MIKSAPQCSASSSMAIFGSPFRVFAVTSFARRQSRRIAPSPASCSQRSVPQNLAPISHKKRSTLTLPKEFPIRKRFSPCSPRARVFGQLLQLPPGRIPNRQPPTKFSSLFSLIFALRACATPSCKVEEQCLCRVRNPCLAMRRPTLVGKITRFEAEKSAR